MALGYRHCYICGKEHGSEGCSTPNLVPPAPIKKQMVRVVCKVGGWFDMDKPDDFDMVAFMTVVKANGHIMNQHLYIPLDMVATIFVYTLDNPPKMTGEGTVLPFPPAGGKPA